MTVNRRSKLRQIGRRVLAVLASAFALTWGATLSYAQTFYSTVSASDWQVATNVGGTDGAFASFPTTGFTTATAIWSRPGWIANNWTGTNGSMETWTFFVFRQSFDLAGYDPTSANLQFQWAADDSGEGFASRGSWTPKYRLNGGGLIDGVWATGNTYDLGPATVLSSGFVAGLNTIDFFVEGNGVTDGFRLETVSFTAQSVAAIPEPETYAMLLAGLGLLGLTARRGRRT